MSNPSADAAWVVRTEFSNDEHWETVRKLIDVPEDVAGMKVYGDVQYVNDERFRGKTMPELVRMLPNRYPGMFCFVVDRESLEHPEHPVLVVGFYPSEGESFDRTPKETPEADVTTFRSLPSNVHGIQINLSLGNMDFEDFAGSADSDGVFRGFPR